MVKFRNIALIIGINKYNNSNRIANLTTARFDAIKLDSILRDYKYDVELLTDEHQKATCDGIRQALGRLPDRLKPLQVEGNSSEKSRLIFYFAGHGIPSQGEDGEAGYLVAQDAELEHLKNFLPMKELHDTLAELKCDHALIILDCCFAGAFKFNTRHLGFQEKREEITKKHYERYVNGAAWQVIASAAHDQKALDVAVDNRVKRDDIGKSDNSPFAAALFRALDKTDQKTLSLDIPHKPADYTKDGITTATELFVFLEEEMRQQIQGSNHQQVPRFWPLRNHGKGEFFFETGEFDPDRLPDTPELSPENNPYRGLESFDEAQQRFFFGREELVKELQDKVNKYSFTIVLGVSGSGKSSLVKAGLIPKLRRLKDIPWKIWKILMPMRPGLSPLKALAKVMLVLEQDDNPDEYQQLENLTEKLRAARKESPGVKDLTDLLTAWLRSDPDGKLHLIVKKFKLWKQLAKNEQDHIQLGSLRQAALLRSGLVLEHLEDLKKDCSDEEKQQLEKFYRDCIARIEVWSNEWRSNPEQIHHLIAQWGEKYTASRLLLVIDQFEELITLSQPDEHKAFLIVLKSIIRTSSQQLRVVATLRADFESRFSGSEYLKDFWNLENRFFVRPMQRYEFRHVIEGPAEDYVLSFEISKEKENYSFSLVDQLIDEVELMPGGLPLLSFTLSELYREYVQSGRNDRTLSWEDYKKLQGVTGSLTRRATHEYNALDKNHQATMRRVMLRMVVIDGGGVTRRRVPETELIYFNNEENERVKLVIDKLINARLIVKGQEAEEQPYIEPAHDFLVRGWDDLKQWIEENQEDLALQQRLNPAVLDWKQHNGVLWTEDIERLAKLEGVLHSKTNNWINKSETEFVTSSIKERQDRIKKLEEDLHISEERLLAAELELDSIALLRQVGIAQNLESLLLAMKNCKRLQDWRSNCDLPVSSYPSISPLFTLQAILDNIHEQNRLEVSRSDSLWMLLEEEKIDQVDSNTEKPDTFLSPDNIHFVTLKNNVVELWKISGELVAQLSSGERNVNSIRFNPDGQIIMVMASSAQGDNLAMFWDTSGFLIITINAIKYLIANIYFSPDSQKLAVLEDSDGGEHLQIIRFFQLKKSLNRFEILPIGDEVGQGHFGKVGFTKDGKYLVTRTSTNSDVRLFRFWNLQLRLQLRIAENNYQETMNIEDEDTSLSIKWSDGIAKFYKDLTQPTPVAILNGDQSWFDRAIFIPNNQYILTTGDDGAVRVWSLAGKQLTEAKVYQNQIDNIFFSKDEQYIVVLGNEGVTIIQDLLSQKEIGKIIGTRSFYRISFSPDRQRFATIGSERIVRIWDFKGRQLAQLNLLSPQVSLLTGRNWSTGDGTNPEVGFTIDGKYVVIHSSFDGGGNPTLLWKVEELDELMHRGCYWLSDYLNNPDINESDKNLCGNSLQIDKSV